MPRLPSSPPGEVAELGKTPLSGLRVVSDRFGGVSLAPEPHFFQIIIVLSVKWVRNLFCSRYYRTDRTMVIISKLITSMNCGDELQTKIPPVRWYFCIDQMYVFHPQSAILNTCYQNIYDHFFGHTILVNLI